MKELTSYNRVAGYTKPKGARIFSLLLFSLPLCDPDPSLLELCQRGKNIIIFCNVSIKHPAIMFCHIQCRMSHQLLKGKSIASTINQILSGKGMSELMDGSTFHSPALVVSSDCMSQSIFCEHFSIGIAEQICISCTTPDLHVFFQNTCHQTA